MHEVSIVQSIIDIVNEYQKRYNFKTVKSLTLEFGSFSCINEDALKFSFEIFAENSVAKNAKLIFKKIPPKITCNNCNIESIVIEDNITKCPECGSEDVFLSGGMEELRLIEMDVE